MILPHKRSFLPLLTAVLLLALPGCQSDPFVQETTCPEELMCTEVFVTVGIRLTTPQGDPVVLDSYETKNLQTGQVYQFNEEYGSQQAYYPVLTDAQLRDVRKEGSSFEFTGLQGGAVVVRERYLIGHDCCHLVLLEGKQELQIGAR
ncbi:hypothetical protein [Cesiribacter andamanensis]|uniref:Lipoprotein n=1 Tax=Cesiribacter andamanensis AMV16 TaxID=1279009 RepID=M7NJA1_9BACT|nr:hypothetical protein [Cesiribacter andamanensis]EMR01850.1 hypothetical protein ADICEAN_03009 [Cesiribacter andamanensis AMV16]